MLLKNIDFTKFHFLWEKSDVCLLNIPFSQLTFPSIGLGILKATLDNTDISASVVYANLLFAEAIGIKRYRRITEFMHPATYIQEWIFAHQAFPESENRDEDYLNLIEPQIIISSEVSSSSSFETVEKISPSSIKSDLILTRRIADEFITELALLVLAKKPKIVGCSSVFSQHVASLAILKEIKKFSPETITLIGGYNCAGEMGLTTVTEFSWIDVIFSGEADESFYSLCKLLIANGADVAPEQLPTGAFNEKKARKFIDAKIEGNSYDLYGVTKDLNKVPEPDYREYFTTIRQMSYFKYIEPSINVLFEASRGCWWHRCTFCGHNPYTKNHRKKEYQQVLAEVAGCAGKYGAYNIEFTDNILSMDYFDDLIPALTTLPRKYKIFFEVKANLKKHHIEALVNANIKWVQAGLEGMNDDILKLLNKGTSTLINIETLKYALEYGLDIWWNILCNFPGENILWFNNLAKDIPLFHHLQPPSTLSPIVFVRFSEYFNSQENYGLKLRPFESLKYIYPLSEEKLLQLVSFFHDATYGIQLSIKNSDKYGFIHEAIVGWQKEFYKKHPPLLIMRQNLNGTIEIHDTRICSVSKNIIISDEIEIAVMRTAASRIRKHNIIEAIERICSQKYTIQDVNRAVDNLKSKNLIYENGDNIISLPVSRRISPTMHPMRAEQNFITTK